MMKALAYKPPSRWRKLRSELQQGVKAIAVGAAIAYGAMHLYNLLYPAPDTSFSIDINPQPSLTTADQPAPPATLQAGEDPWWRGDAEFWREQARLNSAAVAPQYREMQIAWAQMMAAAAEQKALQGDERGTPFAMQAKDARTTELQIP